MPKIRMCHAWPALLWILCSAFFRPGSAPGKDFLTPQEIEKIQDSYQIDFRVKIYMDAALLRLRSAEDRLVGKETDPGDPLEFFTPEDMLDSYYRIIRSVMLNLDDAAQKPQDGTDRIRKALKNLKSTMEKASDQLQILKRLAEEKKKEEFWHLVNDAIEITEGAHDGAEYGLAKTSPQPEKRRR